MKIRMLRTVRPDIPFMAPPGTVLRAGKIYPATANRLGAVCGICDNLQPLGVRPEDFEFIEAPEWVLARWAEICPAVITLETRAVPD